MKNRIQQFADETQPSSIAEKSRRAAAVVSESAGEAAAGIRRWVVDHPASCLAAAFIAGVAVAWLIKRK